MKDISAFDLERLKRAMFKAGRAPPQLNMP